MKKNQKSWVVMLENGSGAVHYMVANAPNAVRAMQVAAIANNSKALEAVPGDIRELKRLVAEAEGGTNRPKGHPGILNAIINPVSPLGASKTPGSIQTLDLTEYAKERRVARINDHAARSLNRAKELTEAADMALKSQPKSLGRKSVSPLRSGFVPGSVGDKAFAALHKVERWEDANGNDDDLFTGANVRHKGLNDVPAPEFSDKLVESVQKHFEAANTSDTFDESLLRFLDHAVTGGFSAEEINQELSVIADALAADGEAAVIEQMDTLSEEQEFEDILYSLSEMSQEEMNEFIADLNEDDAEALEGLLALVEGLDEDYEDEGAMPLGNNASVAHSAAMHAYNKASRESLSESEARDIEKSRKEMLVEAINATKSSTNAGPQAPYYSSVGPISRMPSPSELTRIQQIASPNAGV
jgi:hypothetical protein